MDGLYLLYKIMHNKEYYDISDRFDRMKYIITQRYNHLKRIGKRILSQCKDYESKHRKCLQRTKSFLSKIDSNRPMAPSEKLFACNEAIRFFPYDWSRWDQMFELMMMFTKRAGLLLENESYLDAYYDLKHVTTIITHYKDQLAMKSDLKKNTELLTMIISLKIRLTLQIDVELTVINKWFSDWLSPIFNLDEKIAQNIQEINTDLLKSILIQLDISTLLNIINKFDEGLSCLEEKLPNEEKFNFTLNSKCKLCYSDRFGRQFLAEQYIAKEEILLCERPLIHVFTKENILKYCQFCCQSLVATWPCSGCTEVVFCSYECCQSAWNLYHQYECGIYGYIFSEGEFFSLNHIFRFYCIAGAKQVERCEQNQIKIKEQNKLEDDPVYKYINNEHIRTKPMAEWSKESRRQFCQTFTSLLHHRNERDRMKETCMTAISWELIYFFIYKKIYDKSLTNDLLRLSYLAEYISMEILRALTNGFSWSEYKNPLNSRNETSNGEWNRIGSCLFLIASLFNHNCNPNVFWNISETGIQLRASRPISPGEELTISYGPQPKDNFNKRQFRLKDSYCFFCQCQVCRIDAARMNNVIKCLTTVDCPGPLVLNNYESCLSCGQRPKDLHQIHQIYSKMKKCEQKFTKTYNNIFKNMKMTKLNRHIRQENLSSKIQNSLTTFFNIFRYKIHRVLENNDKKLDTTVSNLIFENQIEEKLSKLESHFEQYRSMVYDGSYHLLNKCIFLIYAYDHLGKTKKIFWLINTINHCLDDIFPKMIPQDLLIPLVQRLNYLCRFLERFIESSSKQTSSSNTSIPQNMLEMIMNIYKSSIMPIGDQSNSNQFTEEHNWRTDLETPIVLHSKFWCLVQRLNRLLYEILLDDMHQHGRLFPKLFHVISRKDYQVYSDGFPSNLEDNQEQSLEETDMEIFLEVKSFRLLKLDSHERYFKKMYENCRRRLSEIDLLLSRKN